MRRILEANPDASDRVGYISGALHKGKPTTVCFVLVGVGALVNRFQGIRRTPNVNLAYGADGEDSEPFFSSEDKYSEPFFD